jgi:hypothetical protein
MISRPALYTIVIGVLGVLAVTWWVGSSPARITIINQSGHPITGAKMDSSRDEVAFGNLDSGQSRTLRVRSGERARLTFHAPDGVHSWSARVEMSPGLPVLLEIAPDDSVRVKARLRELSH